MKLWNRFRLLIFVASFFLGSFWLFIFWRQIYHPLLLFIWTQNYHFIFWRDGKEQSGCCYCSKIVIWNCVSLLRVLASQVLVLVSLFFLEDSAIFHSTFLIITTNWFSMANTFWKNYYTGYSYSNCCIRTFLWKGFLEIRIYFAFGVADSALDFIPSNYLLRILWASQFNASSCIWWIILCARNLYFGLLYLESVLGCLLFFNRLGLRFHR